MARGFVYLTAVVDVASRRVAGWPEDVLARFAEVKTGAAPRRLTMKRRG